MLAEITIRKSQAIEAALANPYFNVLVTDEKIARYLLEGR
jgi:DNA-binding transcriptional regulator LsrR (DeoR family)